MKKFEDFRNFELSKEEEKNIFGGLTRSIAYKGEIRSFSSDNEDLVNSWANAWISLGGSEMILHEV